MLRTFDDRDGCMNKRKYDLSGISIPASVETSLMRIGGVEEILKTIPDDAHLQQEVEFHKALADTNRLKILHILAKTDCCPCVLKTMTGLTDSKLSYHLSKLEKYGMVEHFRDQNWRIYRITSLGLNTIR